MVKALLSSLSERVHFLIRQHSELAFQISQIGFVVNVAMQ